MEWMVQRYVAVFLLLFTYLSFGSVAYGYGYKKVEDPLLKSFKSAIVNGRLGNWDQVAVDIENLDWQLVELKEELSKDLKPRFKEALKARSIQSLANCLANMVFLSIVQKFYWNNREKLANYDSAKARIYSAEVYYSEILESNVMKYDKANGTRRHEEIKGLFVEAQKVLGSPGLFGVGEKPPQPGKFKELSVKIEKKILSVFPFFEYVERK